MHLVVYLFYLFYYNIELLLCLKVCFMFEIQKMKKKMQLNLFTQYIYFLNRDCKLFKIPFAKELFQLQLFCRKMLLIRNVNCICA